ncbi:MAG: hypothetical protein RLN88_10110 [Ekhidna sp.]|uniref:hypothetical protein n=1 Tax=Ekhidna sp. TaxID=2608089 RepID=UPI0032F02F00
MEVIPSAEELISIRDLRNSIVHDYWIEEVKQNFINVRNLAPALMKVSEQSILFCKHRGWLE